MTERLSAERLQVGYNGRVLLRDISFRLQSGRILTLIGPNGAGKSTILRTLTRQIPPLGGWVRLDGRSLDEWNPQALAKRLAVLLTERIRPERMTCEEIVETGRYPYTGMLGILSAADREMVQSAMERTKTLSLRDCDFRHISDGQRQRVLLARALAQQPDLLILDEPTSFLDAHCKLELLEILRDLTRKGQVAVVVSMHELDLAERIADEVLCVKDDAVIHFSEAHEAFTAQNIEWLFDLPAGAYDPLHGSLEMQRIDGEPQVFVLAGGGSGVAAYRLLQKAAVPFCAGVLHENDAEYPLAKALAVQVIAEAAFEPIGDAAYTQALAAMRRCRVVYDGLGTVGTINARNRELVDAAKAMGLPVCRTIEELQNALQTK